MAIAARGTMTGNRGILHGADQQLGTSRWTHKAWICCVLEWQNRKRPVMTGRNWTELFFLDEAVALAAGHRPCGYCRRDDYTRWVEAWQAATGHREKAAQMDKVLHSARVRRDRTQVTYFAEFAQLPSGTFIRQNGKAHLIADEGLIPYSPNGYGLKIPLPNAKHVEVLTPAPIVAVLAVGYEPVMHPSAV